MTGPSTNNRLNLQPSKSPTDNTIYARLSEHDLIIEWDECFSLRLDIEGRWCSLRQRDTFYRRLLDASVVSYTDPAAMPADVADPNRIHQCARDLAEQVTKLISANRPLQIKGTNATTTDLLDRLTRVKQWTPQRFEQINRDFHQAYPDPPLILPPDRYRDLVLMPSRGCPNGQCTFCAFYRSQPFQKLSLDDYQKHLTAVRHLLGSALPLRTGIFLGSANALALPQKHFLEILNLTKQTFNDLPLPRCLAAFWDPDHSPQRTADDWQNLYNSQLSRVFVGLETGRPDLRQKLGKSPDIDRLIEQIKQQQQSNMHIGIIVMTGLEKEQATTHHNATIEIISKLNLTPKDIVYVSPFKDHLPAVQLKNETRTLIKSIKQITPARTTIYQIDRFRYFA